MHFGFLKHIKDAKSFVRFQKYGTIINIKIAFKGSSSPRSFNNLYIRNNDFIFDANFALFKVKGMFGEITKPFFVIFSTSRLIKVI